MAYTKCPYCGQKVKIIPFGYRYIAVCCQQVIYNSKRMPKDDEDIVLNESETGTGTVAVDPDELEH